ncbi:MAG: ankyrin repeat domain-containing protein [Acidimicrobiales bacterium]|nr:ankyrin repeat domain-containing protein [Acidimicrobiales bacterium]
MSGDRSPSPWRLALIALGALVGLIVTVVVAGALIFSATLDGLEPSLKAGCADSDEAIVVAAADGDLDAVRDELDDGVEADRTDRHDNSALACAGPAGHVEVVEVLLDAGADPDTVARDHDSVVADAVAFCQPEVLRRLLDAGADPNRTGVDATASPLGDAVRRGRTDAALLLLDAGADPNGFPAPAIDLAATESTSPCPEPTVEQQAEALVAVLAGGADPALVLGHAVAGGADAAATAALDAGADPDDPQAGSPLLLAAIRRDTGLAELLLAAGAEPDAGERVPGELEDAGAFAVLRCVAAADDQDTTGCNPIAQVLAVADPSTDPYDAITEEVGPDTAYPVSPLLQAVGNDDPRTAQVLIDAGADPNQASALGVTPLHAVAATGDAALLDALIDTGATAPTGGPARPSAIAADAGHDEVADRLRELGA